MHREDSELASGNAHNLQMMVQISFHKEVGPVGGGAPVWEIVRRAWLGVGGGAWVALMWGRMAVGACSKVWMTDAGGDLKNHY